ncbi:FecR family protein [Chryseobacterium sp. DT-3]|uniref:FecR family protein n=1 Tax=Chryseobacterium sp. DT-3 TaxID=3396164 RepID=UPI003F1DD0C8
MDDKFPYLTEEEEDKVWKNAFIVIRRKEKQKRKRRIITFGGMAAIVIFSSGLLGYNLLIKPDVYIANSSNLKIVLPDKSEVILQKGAKLTVEKSFPSDTREVKLDGDAIFTVSKSKEHPFVVHGKNYETKVLGTVFRIYQSKNTFSVDLYEGKVLVYRSEKPNESFELIPKQSFSNLGNPEVARVIPTTKLRGNNTLSSLSFNDCSLAKVAQIIENTYNIKLLIPDQDRNIKITISSTNATAKTFIETLAFQLNLNLNQINDKTFQLE